MIAKALLPPPISGIANLNETFPGSLRQTIYHHHNKEATVQFKDTTI